jgi:hypothetical protein
MTGKLDFHGGQFIGLLGTPYVHVFERCPVLAKVVAKAFPLLAPKNKE